MTRTASKLTRVALLATALTVFTQSAVAHNNPTFREDTLTTLEVPAGGESGTFSLELPKGSVQLIFRMQPPNSGTTVELRQGGKTVASDIGHDGTANIVQGEGFSLAASGETPVAVTVVAKVLDRSVGKAKQALALGKKTYKSANCVGCHKWHGMGGGGYGGAAKSLRETTLTREQLVEVVRCGRPATGMPSHVRGAYSRESCYGGLTYAQLGDNKPPKARSSLRQRNIEAVVDYVVSEMQGRGEPTHDECTAYWGKTSPACRSLK